MYLSTLRIALVGTNVEANCILFGVSVHIHFLTILHSVINGAIRVGENNLPDGFDFLVLLDQTTLAVVTELAVLGSQTLGALFLGFATLYAKFFLVDKYITNK